MNSACSLGSSVSSGWKAQASTPSPRIATGWPSKEAIASTPGPCSRTHGARMKTARSGSSPIPSTSRSASKLCSWRPKALRSAVASIRPRCSASQTISPAQVPKTGRPASWWARIARLEPGGLDPLRDRRALAAGDDQPVEALEVLRRADLARLGAEPRSISRWASNPPWTARTPISSVRPRGPGAGRRRRRDRRSRAPPSPRPGRSRRPRPARGRRSAWSPRRSPGRGARGRRS